MLVSESLSSWENLLKVAKENTSSQWILRPNQSPSSAPISNHLQNLNEDEKPPILLYRDTNHWCPFCERIWFALEELKIPFEVEFIDLGNKPKWYLEMIPTGLVPAVKIGDEIIYESKDILLAIEAKFEPSLLPKDPEEKKVALAEIEACEQKGLGTAGYEFMRGKSFSKEKKDVSSSDFQAVFETKLNEIETLLAKYPGPYFMSDFSLVDIMYSPSLSRFAANLPVFRGYDLRGNDRYPNLNLWFEAIEQRPAYGIIRSDSITKNLVLREVFGLQPFKNAEIRVSSTPEVTESQRMEAAAKLSANHKAIIPDIIKNSGIKTIKAENIEATIDFYLRLLAEYLINGAIATTKDPSQKAIGAVALAYLRNRVCSPRDMTADAAIAFRSGIDRLIASIY